MAFAKEFIMKESNLDSSTGKSLDDFDIQKRRKRSIRDDEHVYNSRCDNDKQSYYPQAKRVALGPSPIGRQTIHISRQNSDDQDDETLIRETQAALKSLSGSWSDSRGSLYKINDQEENPAFQNLFDTQNSHMNSINNNNNENYLHKMSPTVTTTTNQSPHDLMSANYPAAKIKSEMRSVQKYRRDKDEYAMKFRPDAMKYYSQYPSHDFTELVDDTSNDLQIDMASNGGQKDSTGAGLDDKYKELYKNSDLYGSYPNHHMHHHHHHRGMVPFSQSSAFRPPIDNKRMANMGMPPMGNPYLHADAGGYMAYGTDISGVLADSDGDKEKKITVKEEELAKPIDSPDSKQYTILQPAGVGSKAASVMQDIAREGVVSVAAVSSTSSPGLNNVSSTTIVEKLAYEQPMPSFSPGSNGKGNQNHEYTHSFFRQMI